MTMANNYANVTGKVDQGDVGWRKKENSPDVVFPSEPF